MHGVGINDVDYEVWNKFIIDNIEYKYCPYYSKWQSMFQRCYSKKYHKIRPSYKDTFVCEEWHLFSNFKFWMKKQNWQGLQLDKDIIKPGNKEYSPEYCIFITSQLNTLLNNNKAKRGKYLQGVCLYNNKFISQCSYNGTQKYLGAFDTEIEAHKVYINYKIGVIANSLKGIKDKRIINGLGLHIQVLKNSIHLI